MKAVFPGKTMRWLTAALFAWGALGMTAARVSAQSLSSATVNISNASAADSAGYVITDGAQTLSGRNVPNAALTTLGGFDGRYGVITGTLNGLKFQQAETTTFAGRQYFRIGLIPTATRDSAADNPLLMNPSVTFTTQMAGIELAQSISPDQGVYAIVDGTAATGQTRYVRLYDHADPVNPANTANPNAADAPVNFSLTIDAVPGGTARRLTFVIANQYGLASFVTTTTLDLSRVNLIVQGVGGSAATGTAQISVSNLRFTPIVILQSVTLQSASVYGGELLSGTVQLTNPAPAGGRVVSLSSNTGYAIVPASVTVPAGGRSAAFSVTSRPVTLAKGATITARSGGVTTTTELLIKPPAVSTVTFSPATVYGGLTTVGNIQLLGIAPTGGTQVTLSSNTGYARVPATLLVPAGTRSVAFVASTSPVAALKLATITVRAGDLVRTAPLLISTPAAQTLTLSPATVRGGSQNSVGTVTLIAPAPTGGTVVALSSQSPWRATVPASVTIAAGQTSATFTVTSLRATTTATLAINASAGGVQKGAALTVTP